MADIAALKQQFLEYYREVPIQKYAAASIAKTEDTISLWKKDDSDFSDAIIQAKGEFLREKLKGVKSMEWLVERMFKNEFSPPKQDIDVTSQGEKLTPLVIIDTKEKVVC